MKKIKVSKVDAKLEHKNLQTQKGFNEVLFPLSNFDIIIS